MADSLDNPKFTIVRCRAGFQSDNAVFLAQRERMIEGIRMAGVPEENELRRLAAILALDGRGLTPIGR